MKKLLSVLLVLCLLAVPMLALAEAAPALVEMQMETYTHSSGTYSIQYPSDWTLLDRSTIDRLLALASNSSDEIKNHYSNIKAQLEVADIVMFMSPDMQCTANVSLQALGVPLSAEQIGSLSKQMQAGIQANLPDATFPDDGSIVTIGENEYFMLEATYTLAGTEFSTVNYMLAPKATLYTINFSTTAAAAEANAQAMSAILASFVPVE